MSIFDKYNQQRKDGTYQAPKENVTRQSFEATIQRDAPELYNAVHQQRVINMWNNYVDEQRRRYEEALHEATHGRMNRSYLREEMLSGNYQADMAAAKDRRSPAQKRIDQLLGVDSSQITGEKTDWWQLAKGAWYKGADQFSTSIAGGLNWLFGDTAEQLHSLGVQTINDIIGGVNSITGSNIKQVENKGNVLTNWYEDLKKSKAHNEKVFAANANSSRAAQIIDKFGTEFVAAIPMAVEALMMAPYSAAKAGATATTQGLQYISGLQAAKGVEAAGMMARQSASNLMQNPQFWSSYVQAIGDSAETAETSGLSPEDAAIYTLLNGFFNAVIEVGGADETLGGIQNLPMRLQQLEAQGGKKAVVEWFKYSVLGEGMEEVAQGIFERGLKAPATGSPIATLNPNDQNAVFNPWTSAQEFIGGAVVGGLLGGGQTAAMTGAESIRSSRPFNGDAQTLIDAAKRSGGENYAETIAQIEQQAAKNESGAVQLTRGQAEQLYDIIRTQEGVTQYQEDVQKKAQEKQAAALLTSTFTASGIELNETEQETLTRLAQDGDAGTKDTVLGMRDAYRLGQQGKTLEETTLAVEERGLTQTQISRAWGFGASVQTAESGTADVSTEEGKTRLQAALAALGQHTEAAANAYEARQDVGRYAAAMQKAAYLYAANGADLAQIVQDARDGKTADIVGYLTDEQVKLAQQIGQEQRQQVREAERAMSESRAALRQQAAAITAGQTVTAQALAETDTAIDVANRASQRAVNAINQTVERLEAMVKANPNAENTEAYRQAYDEAMQDKKKVEDLQKTVRELRRRKAEMEGKKTIKRKKGTISYAGGTVEGKHYDGVDPEKLTRQQKKVAAMVESLADAVNLDYVFISAEPGMGGAYVKGGTVYVNINAGMGVDGFSQTMAAASLSHELTHWMQDYAPEQYRELKDFIISEILKADPQELRRLVEQQRRWEQGRSLSYEQALDEVVANACQTMLLDSKAITKLARQNMNLAARIADYIEDWTNKIKEAFAEVDTTQGAIYNSLRAVEGSLEHIQELWDNGIEAAAANYNAEKTVRAASAEASTEANENAAPEGDVKNQFIGESAETADKDALALAQQLDKQGVGNESIRQQTGWFKGMDGKWRYEIQGNEMKWIDRWNPEKLGSRAMYVLKEQTELGELIKAPKLFEAYPELKEIRVNFVDDLPRGVSGEYQREDKRLLVNKDYAIDHPQKVLEVIAHETQHAIQDIEGFTSGTSPENWAAKQASLDRQIRNYEELIKEAEEKIGIKKFVEDSLAQVKSGKKTMTEHWNSLEKFIESSEEGERIKYFRENLESLRNKRAKLEDSPMTLYYNTAGEIEARDAAFRSTFANDSQYKGIKPNLGDENTVFAEGAQFQRWDNTDGDTAAEANGREQAYAQIESENAVLKETVAALRKLTDKQSGTIAKLQKRLQITKTPEVREGDAKRMAGRLVREYGSRADRERIAGELKALGDYILQTDAAQLSEDEIKSRARQIAAEILDDAREQYAIEDENLAGIAKSIKGKKLTIDPAFLGELEQAGGFDALRKRNFGLFTLAKADSQSIDRSEYTSVSQFYSDLQSEYGKGYFPDLANEGEELLAIAENARAAAPMEINPFEQYMGEAVEHLSNQIAMDALGGVLREEAPKYADVEYRKEKSRNAELNEHIQELAEENKITREEAGRLWSQVQELATKLDHAEMQYAALQKAAEDRIWQVRAEGIARQVEIKSRERERAAKKIQKLKEHYAEMRQNARERREESAGVSKYRKQIEKNAGKLYTMLMKNDDKLHVPEVLKEPLGAFLESIDFNSKRALAGGEETQKDKSFGTRLQQLQQILSRQQDYINGGEMKQDLGGYIDVSPNNMEFLRNTAEMVTTALNQGREFTINQMSAAELKDLSNFLSNLTTAINGMNRFMANARFESVREAASQDIETIKELGRASEAESGKIFSAAVWENGTPYYVLRRFGEGGRAIFDSFTRGWEKMAFNVQKIMDFTKKTYSDKEVREWQQEQHEINLEDGSKVTMTTGQIMSFSMLLNREQARKHMEKGGVRIGDIEGKKGVVKDITHYHLTEADIQNILGQLTDRQAKVAQALQRFMAEQGAEWGNEISMRRFGYNFYTEGENYFPITTDSTDRPMSDTDAQQNSMFRLLNLSASKALNPKASNALVVNDIFDVFADHMADMAKLNGMGLPILDAIKWFNYKERIDLGDGQYDTRTMQAAIEQAFGDKALSYFRTLMKDINGVTESGDRGTGLLSKLMSNYKAASVAANLRVAFLQPTSYVRASYLIKPKFLLNAFTSHNAYKEAMEYSGTAVWKSLGYYDTNIARGMRDQIKHNESWKDKAVDKSMKLAEFGDQRTWGRLWVACKLQTAAETGLQGEELKQKTADLFREVIYSSQVMDATLTRSELMRGKTMYSKAMTAFMAEPTLSYNMVMDAGMEYYMNVRRHGKAQAWQKSKNYLAKAFTVYACSATFSAIVESVFDALRDDDDMESFFEKWRQAMFGEGNVFGGNLVQDLTIFGKLPYVKSFMSTLQGYKNKDMSNAAFEDVLTAFKIWKETIDLATGKLEKPTKTTYYGNMTQWGKIYKSLQALSELSGLGVSNLTRDVLAVWNTAMDLTNHQELKVRTYESSSDRKRREAITALTQHGLPRSLAQQAMQEPDENGDGSLRQDELGTWLTEKIQSGDITKDQADAIWETQGWKTEREKWAESQEKKEAKAQWQDVLDAANAAGDGKGNVTQEELASYLTGEINAGRLTEAEAEEAWKAAGPTWKKSYAEYVRGK